VFLVRSPVAYHSAGTRWGTATLKFYDRRDNLLPGDPAWFPESVNPRVAVCQILSGYAAAQCLRGPGYF
jgi:hypothetical protein